MSRPLQDYWTEMFKRLQAYQKEHNGSCDVPQRYDPDPQLGKWVNKQRSYHKEGLLTKERCDQLEEIGFKWRFRPGWTEMVKRLQAYQQENNGSCDVPQRYPQDPQLGAWVNKQRYNYKTGLILKERQDQLEQIGFQWTGHLHDKWAKMLKRLQAYQQEHNGSCEVPYKYPPDQQLSTWVGTQRYNYKKGLMTKERCDQLEAIGFEWTHNRNREQSSQDQWTKMFKRLQAYQQEHSGKCYVPQQYCQDRQLGRWVAKQRNLYKNGLLAKERCDQLEAIGFEWTHNREQASQDQWAKMLKRLQAYQQEHNGSCDVPYKYPPDQQLSSWVGKQRLIYKKGLLTKDRFDQLEAVGFEWTNKQALYFQDQWTNMFKRLQAYQQEHNGSCNVPRSYPPDPSLADWVSLQRHRYKKGLLAKERYDQLDKIGFEWTGSNYDDQWTDMLKRLEAYQKEHNGSCNVPQLYPPDRQLGRWVGTQRLCYQKGELRKDRFDQLDKLGFEWKGNRVKKSRQGLWTKMVKRFQTYKQEHNGSCNVPQRYHQDPQLGIWVANQRQKYKNGELTKERCDQLEEIGFQWTRNRDQSFQDRWTKMFKRLQAYQREHNGSCNVPTPYPQDLKLGHWVTTQRSCYKKGTLTKDRFNQLEAIGFEWPGRREQSYEDQWTQMLKKLQKYQQEHNGNCNVPTEYHLDPQLGTWVTTQRSSYKRGVLKKERFDQLEAMGFKWTMHSKRASTQLQPSLAKVSKTKQPDTTESMRWCWL